jgi:hypothetical protein
LLFAVLDGGVGWASQLFGDLIEHWERRSAKALERMHPDKLDCAKLMSLVEKYGYDDIAAALRERGGLPDPEQAYLTGNVENIDDFSACQITKKEDWVDLYAKPYYFGCEADDRMNATAFGRTNPFGAKLNAIFSSDIGHFDVIDMRHPLPEAYELVEDGHITADDFRAFTFTNAVKLWGTQNPRFFRRHARRQTGRGRPRRGADPDPRRRRVAAPRPLSPTLPRLRPPAGEGQGGGHSTPPNGAKGGIEEQTRKLFEVCRLRDVPILTFVNKLDPEGRDRPTGR